MSNLRKIVGFVVGMAMPLMLWAEGGMSSPYTRFGYGQVQQKALSAGRQMGGVGVGFRNKGCINPLNPASYTNVDTLTFAFDVGGSMRVNTVSDGAVKQTKLGGNFDYMVGQFPICKWAGFSFGLMPYSSVGYQYDFEGTATSETSDGTKTYTYTQNYEGSGGINQLFGGVAFKPWKYVSVGGNVYYLFGNIDHSREVGVTSETGYGASQKTNLHVRDVRFRLGVQGFAPIGEDHAVCAGVVWEPRSTMNGKYRFVSTSTGISSDTINTKYGFELPNIVGVGASYTYKNKLTVAVDYTHEAWADARYYGKRDSLANVGTAAWGVEYTPDKFGKRYAGRIRYRLGMSVGGTYVKASQDVKNVLVTAGVGLPVRRNTSFLNVGIEYGKVGKKSSAMLREDYCKLSVSILMVERWFMKRAIK